MDMTVPPTLTCRIVGQFLNEATGEWDPVDMKLALGQEWLFWKPLLEGQARGSNLAGSLRITEIEVDGRVVAWNRREAVM